MLLREDNLGLGAKVGMGNADTFGLSMFSGLLSRLNGKSDVEVQKQQNAIRDVELRAYTGQKHGFMNFVSGGLLVGDKMEPRKSTDLATVTSSRKRKAGDEVEEPAVEKNKRSKSQKSSTTDAQRSETDAHITKREKKGKSKLAVQDGETSEGHNSASSLESDSKAREKREKKMRRSAEKAAKMSKSASDIDEKSRLKDEKRARKEERRKRKEERRERRALKETKGSQDSTQPSTLTSETEGTATPPVLEVFGGRQAVRQRYIQQKRMASMDPQALKEIFMLQAKVAS